MNHYNIDIIEVMQAVLTIARMRHLSPLLAVKIARNSKSRFFQKIESNRVLKFQNRPSLYSRVSVDSSEIQLVTCNKMTV